MKKEKGIIVLHKRQDIFERVQYKSDNILLNTDRTNRKTDQNGIRYRKRKQNRKKAILQIHSTDWKCEIKIFSDI